MENSNGALLNNLYENSLKDNEKLNVYIQYSQDLKGTIVTAHQLSLVNWCNTNLMREKQNTLRPRISGGGPNKQGVGNFFKMK